MNISLKWLSKYVDLNMDPKTLAAEMTRAGLEVESMQSSGSIPEGVVTAKILERKPHENSDHLSVCKVDKGDEVLQIVCGAPNCDAGNIVPLATIGTTFKDAEGTFTIKKGKLRGVESFGMMCSERELGLGDSHEGLMILPADTKLGVPLTDIVETDTVYDCSVTPNRPDWLSHLGVARDIAALQNTPYRKEELPAFDAVPEMDFVTVDEPELCPCYIGRIIEGVQIKESPEWLQKALLAVGLRPINNIVDITNYVLMAYGQPLHAFDIRNLQDGKIVVRRAKAGESIVALDGKTYELKEENLVICDAVKPVAVAGVMGGEYSGVRADTTTVVLESAWFDPASIRATSRKLGLSSDSSSRYERGVDRGIVEEGGLLALKLILELAGGKYTGVCKRCTAVPEGKVIDMKYARVKSLLGMDVPPAEMISILRRLGFEKTAECADGASFRVPSWRAGDAVGTADLAEEIARIYGMDKLPDVPIRALTADFAMDSCKVFENIRAQLCACGLDEIMCGSLIEEKAALADGVFEASDLVRLNNPISLELAIPRPSLLPGMLAAVKHNIGRRNLDLALFELGHVFCANPQKFPEEREELVIAMTGRRHPERYSAERKEEIDFYDLKGVLETFTELRRLKNVTFEAAEDPRFVKGCCAVLKIDRKPAGVFGQFVPALTQGMRLATPLFGAVIQVESLLTASERSICFQPLSQFPATTRDVAFLAPKELENKKVMDFIRNAHVPNLESVELFDLFENDSLGAGKKSMAYTLVFRSAERTLKDEEVNQAQEKLRIKLEKGLGVELR